jgi:hypothetical protein
MIARYIAVRAVATMRHNLRASLEHPAVVAIYQPSFLLTVRSKVVLTVFQRRKGSEPARLQAIHLRAGYFGAGKCNIGRGGYNRSHLSIYSLMFCPNIFISQIFSTSGQRQYEECKEQPIHGRSPSLSSRTAQQAEWLHGLSDSRRHPVFLSI